MVAGSKTLGNYLMVRTASWLPHMSCREAGVVSSVITFKWCSGKQTGCCVCALGVCVALES